MPNSKQEEKRAPRWLVVKAVAAVILVGAGLLMLPVSSRTGAWTPPLTALFMAASATCVTGHAVVDVGAYFSPGGQVVLLLLVQVGGLGFMTLATCLLVLAGRRLSLSSELTLVSALGVDEAHEIRLLLLRTVAYTFLVESAGALLLTLRLTVVYGRPFPAALYQGVFHAVSAFCNAGLGLYPDSLAGFRGDPWILLTITALIILGGIGFLVVHDFGQARCWERVWPRRAGRRPPGRLSLHTRVVIWATLWLLAGGTVMLLALEWRGALAGGPGARVLEALFLTASARTAGFSSVDMAQLQPVTRFLLMILMLIGGAPGSAAGGVKVTTAVVLLAAILAMGRGRREVTLGGRTLPGRVVAEALAVFLMWLAGLALLYGTLLATEARHLAEFRFTAEALLFDAVSGLGTVGLTARSVPLLTTAGQWAMIAGMFIGRCGPLTVALLVGVQEKRQLLRYPEENVMVG